MTAWDALAARRAGVPVFAPGPCGRAGAGRGDPGLLTLDALAGLAQADVVVHDALVDERVLALSRAGGRLGSPGGGGGGCAAAARRRWRAHGEKSRATGAKSRRRRNPISASAWSHWRARANACCGS